MAKASRLPLLAILPAALLCNIACDQKPEALPPLPPHSLTSDATGLAGDDKPKVPMRGNEVRIVDVLATPEAFAGKAFVMAGVVDVTEEDPTPADVYKCALKFTEKLEDGRDSERSAMLLIPVGASDELPKIAAEDEKSRNYHPCRVVVMQEMTGTPPRLRRDYFRVIDWQVLKDDKWQPWGNSAWRQRHAAAVKVD